MSSKLNNNYIKKSNHNKRFEPEKYIGPFDALPFDMQNKIVKAIVRNDRMSMVGHEIGIWHIKIARLFAKLKHTLQKNRLARFAKLANLMEISFQSGIAHIIHKIYKLLLYIKGIPHLRQTADSLLYKSNIEIKDLAVCYARNIPQLKAYRGFYHDESKHTTYGIIVGVDFIPTPEGCWFIESNLNFGMSNTRSFLYERDPFIENLVRFAVEQGYAHLIFVNNTFSYMNKMMAKQLEEEAFNNKIKLTIVEDAYLPYNKYSQSFGLPEINSNDTLVVRTKFYRTSFDYLLQNKRASIRALEVYLKIFKDPYILLPPTSTEPIIHNFDYNKPFPNLVFKFPERDEGKGLIFLKAFSSEYAWKILDKTMRLNNNRGLINRFYSLIEDRNGIFQSYIPSPLLEGRKLYKVRSHVLITPVGLQFLSAHRVISRFSVPEELPSGMVLDHRPYLINLASSSAYDHCPSEENQMIASSTLSVAKGLAWAIKYGFQTTP